MYNFNMEESADEQASALVVAFLTSIGIKSLLGIDVDRLCEQGRKDRTYCEVEIIPADDDEGYYEGMDGARATFVSIPCEVSANIFPEDTYTIWLLIKFTADLEDMYGEDTPECNDFVGDNSCITSKVELLLDLGGDKEYEGDEVIEWMRNHP